MVDAERFAFVVYRSKREAQMLGWRAYSRRARGFAESLLLMLSARRFRYLCGTMCPINLQGPDTCRALCMRDYETHLRTRKRQGVKGEVALLHSQGALANEKGTEGVRHGHRSRKPL